MSSPILQRGLQRAGFTAPPPDQLHVSPIAGDRVELSWRDNAAFEQGFQVETGTNLHHFAATANLGGDLTRITLPVATGKTNFFRVRTLSPAGLSGHRETISYLAVPPAKAKPPGPLANR